MNISNSISELNFSSISGVHGAKIYAWPGYRQSPIEKISPTELDINRSGIEVLLPKNERDEMVRSFLESKNDSLYTANGKNYAASFAIVGTLFSALV